MATQGYREPPPYPSQVQKWKALHLGIAQVNGTWKGVGYDLERHRFTVYSYGGYFDKDGVGGEVKAKELVERYADYLEEIGADWLLPVAKKIASGGQNELKLIIDAYREVYGKPPPGSVRLPQLRTPLLRPTPETNLPEPKKLAVDVAGVAIVGGWVAIVVGFVLFSVAVVLYMAWEYFQ